MTDINSTTLVVISMAAVAALVLIFGIRVWRKKKGRSQGLRRLIHQRLTVIQPHLVSRQTPVPADAMDAIERLELLSGEVHILKRNESRLVTRSVSELTPLLDGLSRNSDEMVPVYSLVFKTRKLLQKRLTTVPKSAE